MNPLHRVALLLACLTAAPAWAAPTVDAGKARTAEIIAAFRAVERPADGQPLNDAQRKANQTRFDALDAFFDRERLLKSALGPHASKLDAAQRAQFDRDFWWLLRRTAFPDSGAFFTRSTHAVKAAAVKGERVDVVVFATVAEEDLETEITMHWAGAPLRLVDASFDGASLTRDYQNQFGRILAKKGPAGLLDVLAKRRAKLEKASR